MLFLIIHMKSLHNDYSKFTICHYLCHSKALNCPTYFRASNFKKKKMSPGQNPNSELLASHPCKLYEMLKIEVNTFRMSQNQTPPPRCCHVAGRSLVGSVTDISWPTQCCIPRSSCIKQIFYSNTNNVISVDCLPENLPKFTSLYEGQWSYIKAK
jgi:hypothetical protein